MARAEWETDRIATIKSRDFLRRMADSGEGPHSKADYDRAVERGGQQLEALRGGCVIPALLCAVTIISLVL